MTVGALILSIGTVVYLIWSYHSMMDIIENKTGLKPISLVWFILTAAYLILIITYILVAYWDHKLF